MTPRIPRVAYEGRFCADDSDGCTGVICFEEVTCVDVPAPGVGAMCGPCPVGYFGDGQKCDGKLLKWWKLGSEIIQVMWLFWAHHQWNTRLQVITVWRCYTYYDYTHVQLLCYTLSWLSCYPICIDINECEEDAHNCTDVCVNVQGGFECACNQGYTLADPTSCTGKGK